MLKFFKVKYMKFLFVALILCFNITILPGCSGEKNYNLINTLDQDSSAKENNHNKIDTSTSNNKKEEIKSEVIPHEALLNKSKEENRYSPAGIDNPKEFEDAFNTLKALVKEDKKEEVAKYVAYPIRVNINNEKIIITTEENFVKDYDRIITDKIKDAFINQAVEKTFVSYNGVMIKDGEVWLNKINNSIGKYSITSINNKLF